MKSVFRHSWALIAVSTLLAGCSIKPLAILATAAILDDSLAALSAETDIEHAREASASLLVMLEGMVRGDPDNVALRRTAAQAYGSYSFGFLEEGAPERARRFYRRGRDHGLAGFRRIPGFGDALEGPLPGLREALAGLSKADLPLLFWTAYCWSGWVNLSRNDPAALADLPRVEMLMARVLELDPNFFYGGPHLFFGVYLGGRSRLLGGKPEKARAHFERAIAATKGKFLMTKVLYARYYAVQVQDRPLFLRLLGEVESAPANLLPEQALANALARRRAAGLRKKVEELF